jgi:hypothetical protein
MLAALLVLATVADFGLAVLLIAISGFVFGGPEGLRGDPASVAAWLGALVACLAAPAIGFLLRRRGYAGPGVLVAWLPPIVALGMAFAA